MSSLNVFTRLLEARLSLCADQVTSSLAIESIFCRAKKMTRGEL
jgi:hypothetical protein